MTRSDVRDKPWLDRLDASASATAQALLGALSSPAAVLDCDGVVVAANRAWAEDMATTGVGLSFPLLGSDFVDLCDRNDSPESALVAAGIRAVCRKQRASFELDFEVSRGEESAWLRVSARPLGDPFGGALVTGVDVTQYMQVVALLADKGLHDSLTGLANRALLFDHLQLALDRATRHGGLVAVAFVDLDDFKLVNDAYGHAAGDQLLRAVATRLRTAVRDEDTVARIGGDEFVVLFGEVAAVELVLPLAERLHECLARPVALAGRDQEVSVTVGCAVGGAGATAESLMADADAAMYRAKDAGKDRVALFSDDLLHRSLHRPSAQQELRRALEREQLRLQYQPIVDLGAGQVVGVEALLRWHHPDLGVVPPADFVPMAEKLGLIVPIGRWVFEEACRQVVRWGVPHLTLSVNVSARQLSGPDFVDVVDGAIDGSGIDPTRLCLELSEAALMDRRETTVRVLEAVRELGPYLAIDDFGTGSSSLSSLYRLPVEVLKVDRSFVEGLTPGSASAAVVASVLGLAHAMGLHVIAEGVETDVQAAELMTLGCSIAQGFLYAPPMPPTGITALLERGMPRPPGELARRPGERAAAPRRAAPWRT